MIRSRQNGFSTMKNIFLNLVFFIIFIGILKAMFVGLFQSSDSHNNLNVKTDGRGVVIGFFNGVTVSWKAAETYRQKIHSRYGNKTPSGQSLQYQLFYNDSYGLMLDLIETFDQRMSLIGMTDRYDLFWGLVAGDKTELKRAVDGSAGSAEVVDNLARMFSDGVFTYLKGLYADKKVKTSASQRQIIHGLTGGKSKQSLVFLAHSQGNLYGL